MCWLGDLITALLVWFEGRKEVEAWGRESQLLSHLLRSGWTSLTLSFPAHSAIMGAVLSAVCEYHFPSFLVHLLILDLVMHSGF